MTSQLTRRTLLKSGAASGVASAALGATWPLHAAAKTPPAKPAGTPKPVGTLAGYAGARDFDAPYVPLNVSSDRVIRSVVGLRPYRKAGFVVKSEKMGYRTVVHNYGHGGCGITLSWGCAAQAADLAQASAEREAIVLGAGVMGLTTALLLLRRGMKVTLYGADLPPNTTSNIAAAFWHPTTLYERGATSEPFMAQFRAAAKASMLAFQHLANGPDNGVWWVRYLRLLDDKPTRPLRPYDEGDDLYPGRSLTTDPAQTMGYAAAEHYHALMIDPDIYLAGLMREVENAGGRIIQRGFGDIAEVMDLKTRLIVNCTGLGAGKLFGDDMIEPVRGQLSLLLPQPEIDYAYIHANSGSDYIYMFPRRGAIVLGGSSGYGDWDTGVRADEVERMVRRHAEVSRRAAGL